MSCDTVGAEKPGRGLSRSKQSGMTTTKSSESSETWLKTLAVSISPSANKVKRRNAVARYYTLLLPFAFSLTYMHVCPPVPPNRSTCTLYICMLPLSLHCSPFLLSPFATSQVYVFFPSYLCTMNEPLLHPRCHPLRRMRPDQYQASSAVISLQKMYFTPLPPSFTSLPPPPTAILSFLP